MVQEQLPHDPFAVAGQNIAYSCNYLNFDLSFMPCESLVNFLQNIVPISSQGAHNIASHYSEKIIRKNEFLLTQGKICNEHYFLESGFMRAFAYDIQGRDVTTNFYSASQVAFEVSSFFDRTASKENIQCLTDCSGWQLNYEQLNILFHTLPEFRTFGRALLVQGFTALKTRMLSMITEPAEERYLQILKTNPEIFRHAPLKHIASYLGITDTSLSRIRKESMKK